MVTGPRLATPSLGLVGSSAGVHRPTSALGLSPVRCASGLVLRGIRKGTTSGLGREAVAANGGTPDLGRTSTTGTDSPPAGTTGSPAPGSLASIAAGYPAGTPARTVRDRVPNATGSRMAAAGTASAVATALSTTGRTTSTRPKGRIAARRSTSRETQRLGSNAGTRGTA